MQCSALMLQRSAVRFSAFLALHGGVDSYWQWTAWAMPCPIDCGTARPLAPLLLVASSTPVYLALLLCFYFT